MAAILDFQDGRHSKPNFAITPKLNMIERQTQRLYLGFYPLGTFAQKGIVIDAGVRPSVRPSVCPSVTLFCEHDISSPNASRLTKFVGDMHLQGGKVPIENQFRRPSWIQDGRHFVCL